eukprot:SAG31_NODE_497_length_14862_cov_6.951568_8_plen_82_part_00
MRGIYAALKFAVSKMDVTVQFLIDAVTKTIIEVEQLYSVCANRTDPNINTWIAATNTAVLLLRIHFHAAGVASVCEERRET